MKTHPFRFSALAVPAPALCRVAAFAVASALFAPAATPEPAAPLPASPGAVVAMPGGRATHGPRPRPARRALPPEAFTPPSNFVALVNIARPGGDAVDPVWLEKLATSMQRSLQTGFHAVRLERPTHEDPLPALRDLAFQILKKDFSEENFPGGAKLVVLFDDAPGLPPILASPYEGWCVMDAGWVKRGGGDESLQAERMGKRAWQALGAMCGASYRPEREAVMRFCPVPEALDECLSHNFHPLNANAFSFVAHAVGLSPVRIKPRAELEALGILAPRVKKEPGAEATAAEPAAAE